MLQFIPAVIGGLFSIGKEYLKNKREVSQALHKQTLKKIETDAKWDEIQAINSGSSWKDEYLTIILTSPFVSMFLAVIFDAPEMVKRFEEAFNVLSNNVPNEYWILLSVVVAASFGMRSVVDVINRWRNK